MPTADRRHGPGKDVAWRFELGRYDRFLLWAAEMLEVPVPEPGGGRLLDPADRAVLEDRLALAGLDVLAPAFPSSGDVMETAI
jgi:hypothetical protein